MPLIAWSSQLSVGIEMFDADHKKLVGMVNELFDAMQAGKGKGAVGAILDRLIDYTAKHFAREEQQMKLHAYPELEAHRRLHQDLTAQVVKLQEKHRAGSATVVTLETLNFLKGWLTEHIQRTDKAYGPLLKARGVA